MPLSPHIELTANAREEILRLEASGLSVRANLIRCKNAELGAVIIHGYGGVRSGPHNLLTFLARGLAEAGVSSIRFDLRGRGESDGDPIQTTLADMAEDALVAAEALKECCGLRRLIIVGICSGGNVGIGVLDRIPEVVGLFTMSVYPFGDADSFKRDAHRSVVHLREYWRKLWLRTTWRKLARGEVNFGIIFRILVKPLKRLQRPPTKKTSEEEVKTRPLDNLLLRRPALCMIYGDADPDYQASVDYYRQFAETENYDIDLRTIAGANHNFYSRTWKDQLKNELIEFTRKVSS